MTHWEECRTAVVGTPKDWAVVCAALESVRSAARARNARLIVAVIGSNTELPEERSGAISRIGGVDKKCAFCNAH